MYKNAGTHGGMHWLPLHANGLGAVKKSAVSKFLNINSNILVKTKPFTKVNLNGSSEFFLFTSHRGLGV